MKRQGTVDATIEIGPSKRLRSGLLLLWTGGALLLALLRPQWQWLAQALWAAAMWRWAASSYGVGKRRLSLGAGPDGWQVMVDGVAEPLLGIRRGIVGPHLVTAVLRTRHASLALMATADNSTPESHWRLRRLAVDGIPQRDQPSLGRGT
jgi:hypothetical protein